MMKYMRWMAAALALSMVLAGCGAAETEENREAVETTEAAASASLGTVQNNIYTNEYMGIWFAPEDWEIAGPEGLNEDGLTAREYQQGVASGELVQVMDMEGIAPDGMSNVNIVYAKMSQAEKAVSKFSGEEEIIDQLIRQMDTMVDSYADFGMQVERAERVSVTFAGREQAALKYYANMQGIPCYVLQIYDMHLGDYSVVTTITAMDTDATAEVAELFHAL